ncbi:wall-associated receptor kinase 2-like [Castanea sativa]|uniref:wall-associated receptor kinase 2-like n=1 Tax=Castanea sativa TaxID=21020 RepID=UPI003F64D876
MVFHRILMQVIWVGVILSATMAATATTFPLALPNCPDSCGNVTIPYPFGTTEGCYLNDTANIDDGYYFINCTSNAQGQPQPMIWNLNVTSISTESSEIDIQMYNSIDCYDQSGRPLSPDNAVSLYAPSFTVSVTKNKFVAVGCDTYAFLNGALNGQLSRVGCESKCNKTLSVVNGTCSGIGCCQMAIPQDLTNINFEAYSYSNHTQVWNLNPCSFAFVIQEDKFNFSSDYLISLRNNETLPMVLEWAIRAETCEVAQNTGKCICGGNSTCIDLKNRSGYRCQCRVGYRGNPYLKDGCQDINECDVKEANNCTSNQFCVNDVGSYHCSCLKGYHLDGGACVPNQAAPKLSLAISLTIGISVGLLLLFVGGSWIYWGLQKRKLIKLREKFFQQNGGLLLQQKLSNHKGSVETGKIYSAEELKKATNNYDESRVLGRGGYGTVYKGILPENKVIAIKKSKIGNQIQIEQFVNEIIVLTHINHRNIVKLLGCCLETEVPLLVYEFITKGTLSEHIHDKGLSSLLSWEKRLKIAAETAGALAYLHSATSVPIIHRDVKPANILLDDNFTVKVSDFGASKLVPLDQTQLNTLVQGTFGYLDPEYFHTSQLTEKSDVYSFGVVLAELLTGKRALSFDRPEIDRNLAMFFISAVKDDCLVQILEDHIIKEGNIEQLKEVANLAKRCLKVTGEDRPSMKEVAMELEGFVIMEKHRWRNASVYIEETEYLLGAPTQSFSIDVGPSSSSSTVAGYDSMRNETLKPLDDGR